MCSQGVKGDFNLAKGRGKRGSGNTIYVLFSIVFGMLLGWLSGDMSALVVVDAILKGFGIWIFFASLLAFYNKTSVFAAISSLCFGLGATLAKVLRWYLEGVSLDGSWILYRLILCILLGMIGFLAWHSNDLRWRGALCCSVPISLLVAEGFPLIYSKSVALGMDFVFAAIIYVLLMKSNEKRLMSIPFILVFSFLMIHFEIFSKVMEVMV